jgi:hypothetical protein
MTPMPRWRSMRDETSATTPRCPSGLAIELAALPEGVVGGKDPRQLFPVCQVGRKRASAGGGVEDIDNVHEPVEPRIFFDRGQFRVLQEEPRGADILVAVVDTDFRPRALCIPKALEQPAGVTSGRIESEIVLIVFSLADQPPIFCSLSDLPTGRLDAMCNQATIDGSPRTLRRGGRR